MNVKIYELLAQSIVIIKNITGNNTKDIKINKKQKTIIISNEQQTEKKHKILNRIVRLFCIGDPHHF